MPEKQCYLLGNIKDENKDGEVIQTTVRHRSRAWSKRAVRNGRGLPGAAGLDGEDKGLRSPGLRKEVTESLLLKQVVRVPKNTTLPPISLPYKC